VTEVRSTDGLPLVSAVIATRDRPVLLRRALESVLGSEYEGPLECVVVFDRSQPDLSLEMNSAGRSVRVISNGRTPGLAGARNTGLLAARGAYAAFCDDDDEWLPGRLSKQFAALDVVEGSRFSVTGMVVRHRGRDTERCPDPSTVDFDGFLADRQAAVHPSSFLFDRHWLLAEVGLVDEDLPGGYAEDYDLLLRVAWRTPIAVVVDPLVRVWWHGSSFFFERWKMIDDALEYLVDKHPRFHDCPSGLARIWGQRALAKAAMGDRRGAREMAAATVRLDRRERRAYLAALVATGAVSAEWVLKTAHRFGKGI
jgi:glycosyltransferase involved in cell wall biosynthesis